jgi:GNAT superfamily N-acetyltransferase
MVHEVTAWEAKNYLAGNDANILFPVGYGRFYGAFVDGKMVGVAEMRIHSSTAKMRTLYVSPENRGVGIARTLFKYRLALCRNRGVKLVRADCLKTSLGMYLKEGAVVKRVCKNGVHKVELILS